MARLTNNALVRPLLGKVFYRQLNKKKVNQTHYPAPFAIIKNWIRDYGHKNAMVNEAKSIATLMLSDTASNLLRVFFLQTQMKEIGKGVALDAQHVHVIGAGTMGGDIAAWCAFKGFRVTLQDQSAEKIAPAMKRAYKLFKKKLKIDRLVQQAMDRLQPDVSGLGVRSADIIIEAIFENLEVKQDLFRSIELQMKPDAILATNTSSIPLQDISQVLQQPERLVGIHFFNPVAKMPLVEIVRHDGTDPELVKRAAAFVTKISRFPVVVASSPGFLVNRVLMPYLMEAMLLLEEGQSAQAIDNAAINFGMPMGPVHLADTVGLDVCLSVAKNLMEQFGGQVPQRLVDMVENGSLGVKTGKGFYEYKSGKKVDSGSSVATVQPDLTDRLILRMLNEAVACLQERVIEDVDLLDAGMIFGTGFAPFRGGPLHYAKHRGIQNVVVQLDRFTQQYGDRFKPMAGWELLVSPGEDTVVPDHV